MIDRDQGGRRPTDAVKRAREVDHHRVVASGRVYAATSGRSRHPTRIERRLGRCSPYHPNMVIWTLLSVLASIVAGLTGYVTWRDRRRSSA
jgi:hypothetical protein